MFRLRRILDLSLTRNQLAVEQVERLFREQFPPSREDEIQQIAARITNPFLDGFKHLVLIVEDPNRRQIKGAAVVSHDPVLQFSYLDFIAVTSRSMGRGVGGSLYEAVREEAAAAGSIGLFFECNPDDPALCKDQATLRINAARLKFYERFHARPIINTKWETPITPGADDAPYLVFDTLDNEAPLTLEQARRIARAVLTRKYKGLVSEEYVSMVVDSFVDDPVQLRPAKYIPVSAQPPRRLATPVSQRIVMVVNSKHSLHHVRSRGYVESPVRIDRILDELRKTDLFHETERWSYPERHIRAVHDADYVSYLKKLCDRLGEDEIIYPYVFPIRNASRLPQSLPVQVGYYCIDTFTPISRRAYTAARAAVDCALTAAEAVLDGQELAYALVRPPGHHAERDSFGGFCYFNNSAIAAQFLSTFGSVAILDIDYHHGNGQQDIFYDRSDVLTVSIHCHPRVAYPHFTGFDDETGTGEGKGFNLNIPLSEELDGERFRSALVRALKRILNFRPRFLVVAFGADTAKGDPTGSWNLGSRDFELNGRLIGQLKLPTVVIQEGGYRVRDLGKNVAAFFRGMWTTRYAPMEKSAVGTPTGNTLVSAGVDAGGHAVLNTTGKKSAVAVAPSSAAPSSSPTNGQASSAAEAATVENKS